MLNGHWRGAGAPGSCSDCWHYHEELRAGRITEDEFAEIENALSRSNGHCMTMGTASTMACVTEALGLTLPGGGGRCRRRLPSSTAGRDGRTADRRPGRARPQALGHPHRGGVRERDPGFARDLRFDECDPPSDRVRRSRGGRSAVAALRRPLRHHSVARRSQAGGTVPDGGLLLRRWSARGAGADQGSPSSRRRHRDRADDRREHRRRRDREHGRDPAGRRSARPRRRARRPHRQSLYRRRRDEDQRRRPGPPAARGPCSCLRRRSPRSRGTGGRPRASSATRAV